MVDDPAHGAEGTGEGIVKGDRFQAIADPTRRAILDLLARRKTCRAGQIAAAFPRISRPAVSRHLAVLRRAGLVTAEGIGREHRYRLDYVGLGRLQRDWFARFAPLSLAALKKQVETRVHRKKAG